jgi:hypothetical protein
LYTFGGFGGSGGATAGFFHGFVGDFRTAWSTEESECEEELPLFAFAFGNEHVDEDEEE